MSHDRGCPCGKEGQDEYETCTREYCHRKPLKEKWEQMKGKNSFVNWRKIGEHSNP